MEVSYNKLYKILINKNLVKKELCTMTGISPYLIIKLERNENVTAEVFIRICTALDCRVE